jgi:hypothetical protein
MRPDVSCSMCRRRAEVGEAVALPTPTPGLLVLIWVLRWELGLVPWRTAREESRPAIELLKAWRESLVVNCVGGGGCFRD